MDYPKKMKKTQLIEEIEALQEKIAELERAQAEFRRAEEALRRSQEETAHGQHLLLVLSQAAQTVQRARTPDEVYRTVGDEMARLGYHIAIITLTDDRAHLAISHLTFEPALLRAAEKLTGLSVQGFRFPLVPGGFFQRIIVEGETTFYEPTAEHIAEALPGPLRPLAGRLASLLGLEQNIVAPLTVGGETIGLLVVAGAGLTEADMPAVTAFANQMAIALERAREHQAVKVAETRYHNLFDGVPVGLYRTTPAGQILDTNPALVQILGYPDRESLLVVNVNDLYVDPEDRRREQALLEREGVVHHFEAQLRQRDGTVIWIRDTARAVRDGEGRMVCYEGSLEDITERKRVEELYRSVVELAPDSIITVDMKGVITSCNTAATRILGYSKDELIGKHFSKIGVLPARDIPKFLKLFKSALEGELTKPLELTFCHKDGTRILAEVRVALLKKDGKTIGLQAISTDITERKRAEEELRKYRDHLEEQVTVRTRELEKKATELEEATLRLQEADRLKSVFLASMSHELRTPLNAIIGFTGILLLGMVGELNEEQRKQLTLVKKSANHLLSLIMDVLDIARIEAGRVVPSPEEFELDDVVREVVEAFSPAVSEKGLELISDVPEGITLFSDRRRVKQVLMNFVSNAVKFTDRGSVRVAAKISEGEKVELRVTDTGIGIKEEDMRRLFQPFQQIDMSLTKRHEGTGLGLYLCQKVAALLGGDVWAKSEFGRGSEFVFTVPLKL